MSTNSFSFFVLFFPFALSHFFLLIFSLRILFLSFCFAFPFFFSFFSSYFSYHFSLGSYPPIWSIIDRMGQMRQFPPHFLMSTCVALIFPYFSFIPYSSFMTSHSHVAHCEPSLQVHHMALPSVTLLSCHVAVGFMCIKANISLRITIYIYCQLIRNLKGHTQKE